MGRAIPSAARWHRGPPGARRRPRARDAGLAWRRPGRRRPGAAARWRATPRRAAAPTLAGDRPPRRRAPGGPPRVDRRASATRARKVRTCMASTGQPCTSSRRAIRRVRASMPPAAAAGLVLGGEDLGLHRHVVRQRRPRRAPRAARTRAAAASASACGAARSPCASRARARSSRVSAWCVASLGVPEHDEGPLGRLDGVARQPDAEEHLAAIRGEGGHEPGRVTLAGVGRLGPVEGREGGGDVPPPTEGEAEVVGRHRDQDPELVLRGQPLRLRQVGEGGLEVALVRAQRALG